MGRGRSAGVARPSRARVRLGTFVALTTFFSLIASASFAAFSVSNTVIATVTSAGTGLTTSGLSTLTTTYTASSTTRIVPVAVSNTGSAPLVLSSVTVSNGGSAVLGAATSLRLWLASTCPTTVPTGTFATTLAEGTTAIGSSFGLAIPAGAVVAACAATVLTTPVASLVGLTSSPIVTLTATVPGSAVWTATDAAAPASLGFTQSVPGPAPTSLTCKPGKGYRRDGVTYSTVDIRWTAPADAEVSDYLVYVNGKLATETDNTSVNLDGRDVREEGEQIVTVSAVVGGVEYLAGSTLTIDSEPGKRSRNITCA
jgi:hypothetical protein